MTTGAYDSQGRSLKPAARQQLADRRQCARGVGESRNAGPSPRQPQAHDVAWDGGRLRAIRIV
jgi:hypothetical protein